MDFCAFFAFSVSFTYFAIFNDIIIFKPLNFTFLGGCVTPNSGNNFVFYFQLFSFLNIKSLSNTILTDSSFFCSSFIKIE